MRRGILSMALAILFVLASTGVVAATSANISPHSQSHAYGQASSWTATWGDVGPYNAVFHPSTADPGLHEWAQYGISSTYYYHSMAFYPCTGTVFTQQLVIDDAYGSANHRSTASEGGGGPCRPQP